MGPASIKEIEELLALGRKYELARIKCGDFEVEFGTVAEKAEEEKPQTTPLTELTGGMPSDDEMLFASSIPLTEDEVKARPPK